MVICIVIQQQQNISNEAAAHFHPSELKIRLKFDEEEEEVGSAMIDGANQKEKL